MVINIDTNKIIELIKTDNLGNFTIRTSANVLPNYFKIKFTAGVDIATNLNNVLELEGIFEKKEITNKLNVSIISTLITRIVENDITDIGTITKLKDVENLISNVFDINNKEIKEDYILNKNVKVTKLVNEINVVSKTLNSAFSSINNNNLKESYVFNEFGAIITQDSSFNFLDISYIDQIVENVIINNNIID